MSEVIKQIKKDLEYYRNILIGAKWCLGSIQEQVDRIKMQVEALELALDTENTKEEK